MTGATGSDLVLVDSSGWLEVLTGGSKAEKFHPFLSREDRLLVPAIVIYEVFKKLLSMGGTVADRFLSHAYRCRVAELDAGLATAGAMASLEHRLAMADAIIYATALVYSARLVTGDSAFKGLPGVTLI